MMPSPARDRAARSRPLVEFLEGREVPAQLIGLTAANTLVTFDSATPGTLVGNPVPVTGLQNGEALVGIDYRTSADAAVNGRLYGVGSSATSNTVYVIDPATGAAAALGPVGGFVPLLTPAAGGFGVDFNPVADKLRVVTTVAENLRIDLTGGTATAAVDTPLAFDNAVFDPATGAGNNRAFFDTNADGDFDPNTNPPVLPAARVGAVAYTAPAANPLNPAGAKLTTLYGIDIAQDLLVTVGGPDGTPSPNGGLVTVAGGGPLGADFTNETGFDIDFVTGTAFATTGANSKLYTVDLSTGAATLVGAVGAGTTALRGLAVVPPAAGGGTFAVPATLAFAANRAAIPVTVTRTGNIGSAASVDYATADGTATAGVDYFPASGTLTFAPGQASRQVLLYVPAAVPGAPSPAETFTFTLSNPIGGAALGATTTTVTIPAVTADGGGGTTPVVAGTRFFTASGGGQVFVYAVGGTGTAPAFTLTPFAGYTGSLAAATGDVNGDGTQDIIIGAGPGGAPRIQVIDGATRAVIADFFAYEETFRGGVYVAAGDVNADGQADILAGTGNGGGPRVRALSGVGLTSGNQTVLADFFTVESTFRGGVTVAAGDFDNDGRADIVAGTGVGGGARVQIFSGASALTRSGTPTALANYLAYADPFRGGVFVAAGDVNGDGVTDVVTGVGSGGGPNVITFSGSSSTPLGSFFAFPTTGAGSAAGVRVAVVDPAASGATPIVAGGGVGGTGAVRFFDALGASAGADLNPFPAGFNGGVFVG